jgi:hypothetical protein
VDGDISSQQTGVRLGGDGMFIPAGGMQDKIRKIIPHYSRNRGIVNFL